MPRPAPVTIATLPCNQPGVSGRAVHLSTSPQRPSKAFVGRKACVETQVDDRMLSTVSAPDAADRPERARRTGDVIRWNQEASLVVDDDFRQCTAAIGNHRGAGGLRLGGDHA